jgi:voltage-gated potassium channel
MFWTRLLEYARRYLGLFFNRRVILIFASFLVLVFGVSTVAILLLERNAPDGLRDPVDVFWWVILTLINVTDPQFFPATGGGRMVGLFLTGVSTVLLWLFSAIVVTIVLDVVLKEGQGMGRTNHKDHILICGWNETAEEILEQLHQAEPDTPVVVLADLEMKPVNFTWVDFVRGDPSNGKDLRRANVMEAHVAIVFPVRPDEAADALSLLTALAIESLNRDVYTCVEVLNPKNRQHFVRANVDEMFVKGELSAHLLARSTLCKGLSGIVSELLRWDEGNEFYKIEVQQLFPSLVGCSFDDALDHLRRKHHVILLGIERTTTKQELTVDPGEELVLIKGDKAIVVPHREVTDRVPALIVSDLLRNNGGTLPAENLVDLDTYLLEGGTVHSIAEDLMAKQRTLLGIQRMVTATETYVNPVEDLILQPDDLCFVIAWDPPECEQSPRRKVISSE